MAAPSSTVPTASPTNESVSFFTYVREVVVGTATAMQDAPLAVVTEAAHLVAEVPVLGIFCKTFLSFEQLVDTAKSNKEDLGVLRDLCEVVIRGILDRRSDRSGLFTGFVALETHVRRAEEVARVCNGRVKQFLLARKICKDIAGVKNDVLAFCTVHSLVLGNDLHATVSNLETALTDRLKETENELKVTMADLEAMAQEVALKTKELQDRDAGDQISDLKAELRCSKEALAAIETKLKEQRRIADLASRVKVPTEAPRIRDWYVGREAVVSEACRRLVTRSSANDSFEKPRMVGLAGPSGVGKSTVASMVVAREDVRASFCKGVLWLQVGLEGKRHLPDLMLRLANMVYNTVMLKKCRQPCKAGLDNDAEDGAAYIREVVDDSSRRFLVVADDVCNVEVLEGLKRAGVWVLYTTRKDDLLPEAPLRLDQVLKREAEMVLRRAADLDDDAHLPGAAYDLMERCNFVVLDLALVGRWCMVRGRRDGKAWQAAVERIVKVQKGAEGQQLLSWRAAVLHAGLAELAWDNPQNKELYLALAVIPKGLAFPCEVAGVVLHGDDCCEEAVEAARRVLETLERWSILTLEGGGKYRVHNEHADFIQRRLLKNSDIRDRIMPRWREHISSVRALVTYSSLWLVQVWNVWRVFARQDVPRRPFEAALAVMDPSSADRPAVFLAAAEFHRSRGHWVESWSQFSRILMSKHASVFTDHPDMAKSLYGAGICIDKAERPMEAEDHFRRALTIQELSPGADHPDVASTLHDLGVVVGKTRRIKEAEGYLKRALTIQEQSLGVDHPDVAFTLQSLGTLLRKDGRTKESMVYSLRALAILEKQLGVDHPHVARILYNLGNTAGDAGRTKEAMVYYRRAFSIQQSTPSFTQLQAAGILHNIAVDAGRAGRTEEAEWCYRRVLAVQEKALDIDDPAVARTLSNLGVCASQAGRTEEGEGYCRRALAILEKPVGADHPYVAKTLHCVGACAGMAGRTEEEEGYYRRALAIEENTLGVDHPDVATTLHNLGVCAGREGRTEEKEGYLRRALAIQEKTLGADHPDILTTLDALVVCAHNAGRPLEAAGYYRRSLAIREHDAGRRSSARG